MYCIYKITNKINGHYYIGQHKYKDESNPMGKYKGSGKILWLAYNKYGFENFETEILYKRIRDKETGEIYKAELDFMDNSEVTKRYEHITDNMYNLPVARYIERD